MNTRKEVIDLVWNRICLDSCSHAVCRELRQISAELNSVYNRTNEELFALLREARDTVLAELIEADKASVGSRLYHRNRAKAKLELVEELIRKVEGR